MRIMDIFAKPPFELLESHIGKVMEAAELFEGFMSAYCREDFRKARELAGQIITKEREADKIKNKVRENLPKSIFMPVSRGDFLDYIKEQDYIIDRMEDVVLFLTLKDIRMPACIQEYLVSLTKSVIEVVKLVPPTLGNLIEFVGSSFIKKKREKVHEYILKLDKKEDITANFDHKVMVCLIDWEKSFSPGELYILFEVVRVLGKMADHAENCGDRIRCMIAGQV